MSDIQGFENVDGRGSMYGVVDTMRQLTRALEDLLNFLPADFVWPTQFSLKPLSTYVEWGRDDPTAPSEPAVWLTANAEAVQRNANFRPGWPHVAVLEFDAQTAAEWLQSLTRNWVWEASHSGSTISSSLRRGHMNA